jgi:hypothetical protein
MPTPAPTPITPDLPGARFTIDLKVPLWGMLCAAGAGFVLFASLYFSVQALTDAVRELQITVKSGNTSVSVLTSENALLKFRVGSIESDMVRVNEYMRSNQKGSK